jgi:hypothetical protein
MLNFLGGGVSTFSVVIIYSSPFKGANLKSYGAPDFW